MLTSTKRRKIPAIAYAGASSMTMPSATAVGREFSDLGM
jgi:hypothetical protein